MNTLMEQDETLIVSDENQKLVLKGWLVLIDDMGIPRQSFELLKPVITIGRDSDNDIVLDDKTVSRLHCFIKIFENEIVIIEEDAVNGMYIDDYPRTKGVLEDGMIIRLGKIFLCVKYI